MTFLLKQKQRDISLRTSWLYLSVLTFGFVSVASRLGFTNKDEKHKTKIEHSFLDLKNKNKCENRKTINLIFNI